MLFRYFELDRKTNDIRLRRPVLVDFCVTGIKWLSVCAIKMTA